MLKLFMADLKMLRRNKQALFWTFMFPLMFTFIFGFFFGKNTSVGTIGVINKSNTQVATQLEKTLTDSSLFKVTDLNNKDDAQKQISNSTIAAAIYIPENFGSPDLTSPKSLDLLYDPGNSQANSVLLSFLNQYLNNVDLQIQNAKPIFEINQVRTTAANNALTYFDFVLVGIIGIALMNSSVNGIAISMSKYREDKILKRITTTPVKTWQFIVSEVLSRIVLNFFQIAIIILIGVKVFDAHIYGSLWIVMLFAIIGAILFQLLGFCIASVSKTTDAAEGMATAVNIPMMFLAGVFFPIDSLPNWLHSIVQYLPLAPLLRILRGVALESKSPFDNPINLVIVGVWIVVLLGIATYKFRLTEE